MLTWLPRQELSHAGADVEKPLFPWGTQALGVLELEVRPAIDTLAPCITEDSWQGTCMHAGSHVLQA